MAELGNLKYEVTSLNSQLRESRRVAIVANNDANRSGIDILKLKNRMGEIWNLKEEATSLNSQLRENIIKLEKLLDCTNRNLYNATESNYILEQEITSLNQDLSSEQDKLLVTLRELENSKEAISKQQTSFNLSKNGLRNEMDTVQTALARANVRIQNQSKDISSLHSLRQKDEKRAATMKQQETTLKQFLNENKNLKQQIGNLETYLFGSDKRMRDLNEEVTSLNDELRMARHDATRSGNDIIELKKVLDDTKRNLCNETEKFQSSNDILEEKITSLNHDLSSEQNKLLVAHRDSKDAISKYQFNLTKYSLRNENETVQTTLARANVRIKNQSKEISSLRQKDDKLTDTINKQETKLKQFLNEKKNLNQRIGDLESTLRTQTNKSMDSKDECSLCCEIVRYTIHHYFSEK